MIYTPSYRIPDTHAITFRISILKQIALQRNPIGPYATQTTYFQLSSCTLSVRYNAEFTANNRHIKIQEGRAVAGKPRDAAVIFQDGGRLPS